MTQPSAEGTQSGLGRYRFREILSTSFFGPRLRAVYVGTVGNSDAPPSAADANGVAPQSDEHSFALRLVEADSPSVLDKLARAVQALREVDHPGVVKPLKVVRASTRLGVVSPDIAGVTLAKLLHDASLRKESISPSIALRIIDDVLEALQVLQLANRELLGRDATFGGVTPDSIHLGLDGQARYLDPGLASAAARQSRWSHEAVALAYTAPEQTGADHHFAATSDVFSLGVILWELLTLRPLFGADTAAETLQRVHQARIPRVQRQQFVRGEPIASALAQVVAHALRRNPGQRYASYDEFASELSGAQPLADRSSVAELVQTALDSALRRAGTSEVDASQSRVRLPVELEDAEPVLIPPQLPAANDQSLGHTAATFETPTARIPELVRDSFWPASAAWEPALQASEANPNIITAFPIGDLLRAPHSGRRDVWSVAAACIAALGLGFAIWANNDAPPPPAAASSAAPAVNAGADPTPAPSTARPSAQAVTAAAVTADAGVAQTRVGATLPAGPAPMTAAPSTPASASTHSHRPARSTAPRPSASRGHSANAPAKSQQPFIPDDI
jgi:hypothetical protein